MPSDTTSSADINISPLSEKEKAEDQRWEKADKPISDSSPNALKEVTPLLQIGALVAGFCGPPGKVIGGVLSLVVAVLGATNPGSPGATVDDIRKAILEINSDERAKRFIDASSEFDKFILTHSDQLQFKSDNDMELLEKTILPGLAKFTDNSELLASLDVLKDDANSWGKLNARLAIVYCISRNICAYSLVARIYAAFALSAKAKGDDDDHKKQYETHKTTYEGTCDTMSKVIKNSTDELKSILEKAKADRVGMFKEPVDKSKEVWSSPIAAKEVNFDVHDDWTDKSNEFKDSAAGGALIRAMEKQKKDAQDYYDTNKPLLEAYVDRSFRNTKAMMASWTPTLELTKAYLKPTVSKDPEAKDGKLVTEKVTPKASGWEKTKETPNGSLINASYLSFAYKLSSSEGESEMSNWTDWIEIKHPHTDDQEMPVIEVDDFGYPVPTERHVYVKIKMVVNNRNPLEPGTHEELSDDPPEKIVVKAVRGVYKFGGAKLGELVYHSGRM